MGIKIEANEATPKLRQDSKLKIKNEVLMKGVKLKCEDRAKIKKEDRAKDESGEQIKDEIKDLAKDLAKDLSKEAKRRSKILS